MFGIDPNCIPDGHYPGSFISTGGPYRVTVIVLDHRIESVAATQIPDDRYAWATETMTRRVVDAQIPYVDMASGDEATSKALLKAFENALPDGGQCQ